MLIKPDTVWFKAYMSDLKPYRLGEIRTLRPSSWHHIDYRVLSPVAQLV